MTAQRIGVAADRSMSRSEKVAILTLAMGMVALDKSGARFAVMSRGGRPHCAMAIIRDFIFDN